MEGGEEAPEPRLGLWEVKRGEGFCEQGRRMAGFPTEGVEAGLNGPHHRTKVGLPPLDPLLALFPSETVK